MKSMKKLLALLLVVAMCLALLAACSSSDKKPASDDKPANSGETDKPPVETPATPDEPEEIAEISMCYFDVFGNGEKGQHVEDAINEIMESEYNLRIDIKWWAIGDYATQLSLAASSGDLPDIIGGFPMVNIAQLQANGYMTDLTPYLDSPDAAGFMSQVGSYMSAYNFADGIWGIPSYRIYCTLKYIIMRQDILEELGMVDKAQNMTTWGEYEEIMQAVADNYSDLYPIGKGSGKEIMSNVDIQWKALNSGGAFMDNLMTDKLGDVLHYFCADDQGNVIGLYENEYFIDSCEKAAEWYQKGWVYPDGAFTDDHGDVIMKQGVDFSDIQSSEVGIESAKESATGYKVVCTPISGAMVKTSDLTTWGIGLSNNCGEPEAALRFISAYYTDERIENLMTWGVEGVDYTVNAEGEACFDGVNSDAAYHSGDWIHGNQFLALPWAGQGGDFRAVSKAINDSAVNSPYLGFAMDMTGLEGLTAAITSVDNEYWGSLTGGYFTEDLLAEFIAKMESAGAKDYIAAYQQQLDAWKAAQ